MDKNESLYYIAELKQRFDNLKTRGIETNSRLDSWKHEIYYGYFYDSTVKTFRYQMHIVSNEYIPAGGKEWFISTINKEIDIWKRWHGMDENLPIYVMVNDSKWDKEKKLLATIMISLSKGTV